MLINNNFLRDKDEDRLERLILLSGNIDTYSAELGLAPERIAWAQGAEDAWQAALSTATVEDGEMDDAFEDYHRRISEVYARYTAIRELLEVLINEFENPNDLAHAYGFEGPTPQSGKGLINAIDHWRDKHERMLTAGEEPVIGDALMDELVGYRDELREMLRDAETEREESRAAYKAKALLFATDSKQLGILFRIAKVTWGDDDSKLRLLGFVPSSEIWTPGQPPLDWPDWPGPAETFTASIIEPGVVELVYSGVKESTIGWLHRRKVGIVDWTLVADDLPMNAEDIVPFRDYDVLPATWEYRFIPMRGDEHGEASYAIIEVE